ncbi:MAG TPA: helix-turn-helix domain-containing protein [Candidatus Sulfotelmatobacter sp.]|nr:helix-turn-helix domain-containing protein [Candidatus Sulfotelmatobacter sp.]
MSEVAEAETSRYRRVLRAAEELFKRDGFRGVTMEAVARGAAVAKPTLYSYFKNKDELYVAVCARLTRLLRETVEHALTSDEPLDARLANAIVAKHRVVFTLVRSSPHAAELFSAKDATAAQLFADLDETLLGLLAGALRVDDALARRADTLARALYFGSAELAARSASADAMDAEVRDFVAVYLAGARALARKDALP